MYAYPKRSPTADLTLVWLEHDKKFKDATYERKND
jgi:hypothetical protein